MACERQDCLNDPLACGDLCIPTLLHPLTAVAGTLLPVVSFSFRGVTVVVGSSICRCGNANLLGGPSVPNPKFAHSSRQPGLAHFGVKRDTRFIVLLVWLWFKVPSPPGRRLMGNF